ncbi:Hypothetical predicted protein, partial [Olea europaea subsp. europaea]
MALRRGENPYNSDEFLPEYNTSAAANKTHTRQIAGKSSSKNIPCQNGEELDVPRKLYLGPRLRVEFARRRENNTYNAKNILPRKIHHESRTQVTADMSQNRAMANKLSRECLPLQKGEDMSIKKLLTGKKILVADDDPIGRKMATTFASQL